MDGERDAATPKGVDHRAQLSRIRHSRLLHITSRSSIGTVRSCRFRLDAEHFVCGIGEQSGCHRKGL